MNIKIPKSILSTSESILKLKDKNYLNSPIEEYKNQEHLNENLEWWKNKLFLTDWIIKASICEPHKFIQDNVCGENEFDMVNKCCVIRILDRKSYGDRIMKYCAERVLVHELLHCKYNWIANESSYEGKYVEVVEHGLLEQMAKSLVMAKYNLEFDYFVN